MLEATPQTKEEVVGCCSGNESDEDEDVEEEPVRRIPKRELLPSCQFLRHGKYENRNDLVFRLNEMLRRKFIIQENYEKAIDTLDIEMVAEEEI